MLLDYPLQEIGVLYMCVCVRVCACVYMCVRVYVCVPALCITLHPSIHILPSYVRIVTE